MNLKHCGQLLERKYVLPLHPSQKIYLKVNLKNPHGFVCL